VHDFQTQTGETLEASVIAYDAQQFSLHQFDIGLLELRALHYRRGDIKWPDGEAPMSSQPGQFWLTRRIWAASAAD
jgi:hypothetical protein